MELAAALNKWRQRTTARIYGDAVLRDVGSSLVLPNELLERLVDCAHFGKMSSMDHLRREIDYDLSEELGLEILQIIKDICPPPSRPAPRPRQRKTTKRSNVRPLGTNSRLLNTQPRQPAPQSTSNSVRISFLYFISFI